MKAFHPAVKIKLLLHYHLINFMASLYEVCSVWVLQNVFASDIIDDDIAVSFLTVISDRLESLHQQLSLICGHFTSLLKGKCFNIWKYFLIFFWNGMICIWHTVPCHNNVIISGYKNISHFFKRENMSSTFGPAEVVFKNILNPSEIFSNHVLFQQHFSV